MEKNLVVGVDLGEVIFVGVGLLLLLLQLADDPVLRGLKGVVERLVAQLFDLEHCQVHVVDHFVEEGADLLQVLDGFGEALSEVALVADGLRKCLLRDGPLLLSELVHPVLWNVSFECCHFLLHAQVYQVVDVHLLDAAFELVLVDQGDLHADGTGVVLLDVHDVDVEVVGVVGQRGVGLNQVRRESARLGLVVENDVLPPPVVFNTGHYAQLLHFLPEPGHVEIDGLGQFGIYVVGSDLLV